MPSAPLFSWLNHRASGVLLHPTSLPGDQGIGVLDESVDLFLEFLATSGMRYWQTCPLGHTGYGDSPYQSFSAFAGNPYLIDLAPLVRAGVLAPELVAPLRQLPRDRVDYGWLYVTKWPALVAAAKSGPTNEKLAALYGSFENFCADNANWLEDYAYFLALKNHFGGRAWQEWPQELRTHATALKSLLRTQLAAEIRTQKFVQYVFFGQWRSVKTRAEKLGISIIGDIPIFVAPDSADVWANPELFQLDPKTLRPTAVAGVPPDYFAADGQLWGNPLYDWAAHTREGYAWWLRRMRAAFELCDVVRIDHFRGFESYWSVPATAPNARSGVWKTGPGLELFSAIQKAMPHARIIAEDLGEITPAVHALREDTGLPGMAVLQFAFGGEADNTHLPHNLAANTILYTGTHDNDTTRGWYESAPEKARDHARRYLRISGEEIAWDFVRTAFASVANLAIFPLQDLLSLDGRGRFNTPGKPDGNWQWRYEPTALAALRAEAAPYLHSLAELYGRLGKNQKISAPSS